MILEDHVEPRHGRRICQRIEPNAAFQVIENGAHVLVTVPGAEQRIELTRGGTLVIAAGTNASELVKLVKPNGEEYVLCYCNGISEIRLQGATTKVDHVAPGAYRMDVIDGAGKVFRSYPVTIGEGQLTAVDVTK